MSNRPLDPEKASTERGGKLDPITETIETTDGHADDDSRVDEAIAESFPASDPPSSNSGVDKHDGDDDEEDKVKAEK